MNQPKFYKTPSFAKAAKKARIPDSKLFEAMTQVVRGQCDEMGGGVYKKRLKLNMYRGIVLSKRGGIYIMVYLFAKSDRANITNEELEAFRDLADIFANKTKQEMAKDIKNGNITEVKNTEHGKNSS